MNFALATRGMERTDAVTGGLLQGSERIRGAQARSATSAPRLPDRSHLPTSVDGRGNRGRDRERNSRRD